MPVNGVCISRIRSTRGDRRRRQHQHREHGRVAWREQAEAPEQDGEPERDHQQERRRDGAGLLGERDQAGLQRVGRGREGLRLSPALHVVLRREREDLLLDLEGVPAGEGVGRRARRRRRVRPDHRDPVGQHSPHLAADGRGLRSVLREGAVEQQHAGRDVANRALLGVKRILARGGDQPENQRRQGRDQPHAELHDRLRVVAQVVLRQGRARAHAEKPARQREGEHDRGDRNGAHVRARSRRGSCSRP